MNNQTRKGAMVAALVAVGALAAVSRGGTISLDSAAASQVSAEAIDLGSPLGALTDMVNPSALPESGAVVAASSGSTGAADTYNFTESGFAESNISLAQSGSSAHQSRAVSQADVFFSVSQPTQYAASGSLSESGGGSAYSNFVKLSGELQDITTGAILLDSIQISTSTPNQAFTLDGAGGDFTNLSIGASSGTLIPGDNYEWQTNAELAALLPASSANAIGSFDLALMDTQVPGFAFATPLVARVVPAAGVAPGIALLLGLLGGAAAKRRRFIA